MIFNYDFDIAALFIEFIVIFFYFYKKKVPSNQGRTFFSIVITLVLSTLLEITTILTKQYTSYVPMNILWLLECLYYTTTNTFGPLYFIYALAMIEFGKTHSKSRITILKWHIFLPYLVALAVIWLSPVLADKYPLAFSILPFLGYVRNNNFWFYLLYVISIYYIVVSFMFLYIYRKNISTKEMYVIHLYVGTMVIAAVLQLAHYGLFVQNFSMALTLLVFFFYIIKPEKVVDTITDTFNQPAFIETLDQLFNRSGYFTCVAITLDDTVFMGNTIGINQMNMLLKEVATYLKSNFGSKYTFSISPECFCVIVRNPNIEKISNIIDMLQARFANPWTYETVKVKLYSRICIINNKSDAKNSGEVIDIISMIMNDDRYKNPVLFAEEIDVEDKRRTTYIEHALRNGITENRFDVYYQPIYSVAKKQLIGAEALIRLKDEDGKFISPEDFIPIAEKTGTILRIGEFVYESVCRTLSTISVEDYGIEKIDINLSVAQCMQEILAEQILAIQNVYKIPTSIINLEITETAAAHTPEILLKNMQKLAEAGFELSLDDYGSGYSNMNYMLNLPFKLIKIDKYIVWAAYSDERAEKALSATIKMIKSMGMTVLAEGVEEKDQVEWLIELGCDYLQGFFFSQPVPKKTYLDMMKNRDKYRF